MLAKLYVLHPLRCMILNFKIDLSQNGKKVDTHPGRFIDDIMLYKLHDNNNSFKYNYQ